MITVKTQVKEIIKEQGIVNLSNDYIERLDEKVKEIVLQSVRRAKENGRKTVMGKDI